MSESMIIEMRAAGIFRDALQRLATRREKCNKTLRPAAPYPRDCDRGGLCRWPACVKDTHCS